MVEIERGNPNSPLYSVKSFEELNIQPQLLKVRLNSVLRSVSLYHQVIYTVMGWAEGFELL